jgi:hypothetical protein
MVPKIVLYTIAQLIIISSFFSNIEFDLVDKVNAQTAHQTNVPFIGVDMKGLYTSTIPKNLPSIHFPDNY